MQDYEQLTAAGQVRRLRALARESLEAFGLGGAELTLIRHWQNTTFRVDVPEQHRPWSLVDPFVPGRYLLRLHRPREKTASQIGAELAWLEALAGEGTLVVPRPCRTLSGEPAFVASNADWPSLGRDPQGSRVCSLLRWMPGRIRRKASRRPSHMRLLGAAMAHLHEHVARWPAARTLDRATWDVSAIMGRNADCGIDPSVWDELPDEDRDVHLACEERLAGAARQLGDGPDAFGLVHADLHFANVLFAGGQARPIDFDDCAFGYLLYDIASTMLGFDEDDPDRPWLAAFLSGYRTVRPIADDHLALLDVFLAARASSLLLWCQSSARHHESFRKALPRWRELFLPAIRRRLGHA